jgi:hypothetical protein
MDDAIRERLARTIDERIGERGCPLCGKSEWSLLDGFVAPTIFEDLSRRFAMDGRMLPCVAIACRNCGNTHQLNITVLGLNDLLPDDVDLSPVETDATVDGNTVAATVEHANLESPSAKP